ncbi:methyltransferase [Paenibacillus sp. MBLB4367]|uniref:methyltransferase n=1 Tax=Paenibacillus sp. MBLB4367 TaxID=3384767 RepID=UPI0039082F9B
MAASEWDERIEYLRQTRDLYYNDDYLEFLVKSVWKLTKPVRLLDFGCGYGYLGLKLLPLLPKGSSYTGVDQGKKLLSRAEELFGELPYETAFILGDVHKAVLERDFDIVLCHAFLLHMTKPLETLRKMIDCVKDGGKIICFEPHWIACMADFYMGELDQSQYIRLGVLQKLFEEDARRGGKDGNIGAALPHELGQLGVKEIQCRMSDKVVILEPGMERTLRQRLFDAIRTDGFGDDPGDRDAYIERLLSRGTTRQEAEEQYEAEALLSSTFSVNSRFTHAPSMKITFGTVIRDSSETEKQPLQAAE